MRSLDRKLLRNIWQIKSQVLAIGLVIAAGVAVYIMYFSTFESLRLTQTTYYDNHLTPAASRFSRRAATASGERSTNTALAAPRDSASIPMAPVPAYRSRILASSNPPRL